jgi:hypothetical protein
MSLDRVPKYLVQFFKVRLVALGNVELFQAGHLRVDEVASCVYLWFAIELSTGAFAGEEIVDGASHIWGIDSRGGLRRVTEGSLSGKEDRFSANRAARPQADEAGSDPRHPR